VPEVTQYTERILIVLNPDASIKGIAIDDLQLIDGVAVKQKQVAAESITDPTVVTLLGEIGVSAATEVLLLRSHVATLTAEKATLAARVAELEGQLSSGVDEDGVPIAITPLQGRLALKRAGLLESVEAAIVQANWETQIWWEYATLWHRSHSLLKALATSLGLTSEQVDELFKVAGAIQ